jgi:chemotaxis protein CheD
VLGSVARKVCFLPASGKAMVKRLTCTPDDALFAPQRAAAPEPTPAPAVGTVDLF